MLWFMKKSRHVARGGTSIPIPQHFDRLPEELLSIILYFAWSGDNSTFLSLLRVNKRLHRIGKDLLYTDVHNGSGGFPRTWLETFAPNSFASKNIRSLTVSKMSSLASIHHTWSIQFFQASPALGNLTTYSFNNMSLLTTFTYSYNSACDHDFTSPGCTSLDLAAMEFVIKETLLALPVSVVDLELMIDDVFQPWQFASLCPIVGALLPRLETCSCNYEA